MEALRETGFSHTMRPFLTNAVSKLRAKHLAALAISLAFYFLFFTWQLGVIVMASISLHQIAYAWLIRGRGPTFLFIPFVGLAIYYYHEEYFHINEGIGANVSAALFLSSFIVLAMAVWLLSGSVFFATAAYYLTILSFINLLPLCYFSDQHYEKRESLGFFLIGSLIAFAHQRFAFFLASVLLLGAFLGLFFLGNWLLFLAMLIFIGHREGMLSGGILGQIRYRGGAQRDITPEIKRRSRFWIFFFFVSLASLLLILISLPEVVPAIKSARIEYLGYAYNFFLRFFLR